jgi:hypothetical protein
VSIAGHSVESQRAEIGMNAASQHIAIIERHDYTEKRAVLVPPGQSLGMGESWPVRPWLMPYLGSDWHLVEFLDVQFQPIETPHEGSGADTK